MGNRGARGKKRKSNGAPAESSAGPSSESNVRLPARRDNVPPSLPPQENSVPRSLPPASSIGTTTFSSGAAVLDAVRRQYNRLIVAEAGQERRRILATMRDFLPPFVFEEMRESILETVGYVPMVGPKGGLYRGWDSHRDDILLVFQSMRTSYHLRNLFIRPHYQLMLRLVENYIDTAISMGFVVCEANDQVDGRRAVRIAFPGRNYAKRDFHTVIGEENKDLERKLNKIPLETMMKSMYSQKDDSAVMTDRGNMQVSVVHSAQNQTDDSKLKGCCVPALSGCEYACFGIGITLQLCNTDHLCM